MNAEIDQSRCDACGDEVRDHSDGFEQPSSAGSVLCASCAAIPTPRRMLIRDPIHGSVRRWTVRPEARIVNGDDVTGNLTADEAEAECEIALAALADDFRRFMMPGGILVETRVAQRPYFEAGGIATEGSNRGTVEMTYPYAARTYRRELLAGLVPADPHADQIHGLHFDIDTEGAVTGLAQAGGFRAARPNIASAVR